MKIHLISHTKDPLKSIAAAILNIGIGKDIRSLSEISEQEAKTALADTLKSWLDSPLEFASFNFFWEDLPLYMRSELVRARVGCSYAERSLRFYQAGERDPISKIDWKYFPSIKTDEQKKKFIEFIKLEMDTYEQMKKEGIETQDARNVIGVWYGTAMQTAFTFRALRNVLSVRLSSQAHPAWQDAAHQIKQLVAEVDKTLGNALVDVCELNHRCVWHSKLDRPCQDCINRGRALNHVHSFSLQTKTGEMQCSCGVLESELNKN